MNFLTRALDILFPPHPDVVKVRTVLEEALLAKLALRRDEQSGVYTGLSYKDDEVRAIIRANKFHHDSHAARLLGTVFFEMLSQILEERGLDAGWKNSLIIPVPSSGKRRRERGGNQVEWIIESLPKSSLSGFRVAPRVLARRERESQARIPRHKRRENIRDAFFVPPNGRRPTSTIRGASIILLDDVSESGATMKDAVRALKAAGASRVIAIALAK